jgi:tetratricopeptide (TPR) repeat protein
MSHQDPGQSAAMKEAIHLIQRGLTVKAEEVVRKAAGEARSRSGPGSLEHASALNDLASILLYTGQNDQAIETLRQACAGPAPKDQQAARERLTFEMNLGFALERAGRLDEAEQVLRHNVEGRARFYGREHPGHAFGLEPLAGLLLRMGRAEDALPVIEETAANFRNNRHPRIATALVLRAEVRKAAGDRTPAFADTDDLPDEIIGELVSAVLDRAGQSDPRLVRAVLDDLLPVVRGRLGEDHNATVNVLTLIANLERDLGPHGDPQARVAAIRQVIAVFDRRRDAGGALQATMGLALAQGDMGQPDQADATYREAEQRARQIADAALLSQVLRNHGLLLAELKRMPEAEELLRGAVAEARRSRNQEMLGRGLVALGIFHQHGGQLEPAAELLREALQVLDPAHPDAVCGRGHLGAIETGGSCGCGNTGQALADAFREFVLKRLPPGLVQRLEVTLENNNFNIGLHLDREPAEEEVQLLQRVITHAQEEFRKRVGQKN